jgi:hypothetical protein
MQAANNATDSVIYTRSQEVWRIVSMASENIGRFYPGSPGVYFSPDSGLVYDSGTPGQRRPNNLCPPPQGPLRPATLDALPRRVFRGAKRCRTRYFAMTRS